MMSNRPARLGLLVAAGFTLAAMAAARPEGFSFDPQPRWAGEPDTDKVCEAMASECPGQLKDGEIEADWAYAELYDADGYLVGIRSLKSTGCRPLDEHMLLSHRQFRTAFSKDGQPDLDDMRIEVGAGSNRDSVRLVKTGETSVSIGC
jgi:hypothetical protein